MYREQLLKSQPETPVIKKGKVHKDIVYALSTISEEGTQGETQEIMKMSVSVTIK